MTSELASKYSKFFNKTNMYLNIFSKIAIMATYSFTCPPATAMETPNTNSIFHLKEKLHKELIKNHPRVEERRSKCGLPEPEFCGLEVNTLDTSTTPKILQMAKITSTLTTREELRFEALQPGGFSDIIYMVYAPQTSLRNPLGANCFVIKRHKWNDGSCVNRKEETPQKTIQNLIQVNKIIPPKLTEIKDRIIIAETLYSGFYFDLNGCKRYLSIIEGVPGKDIDTWMTECKNYNIPPNKLNWIMSLTGEALGLLHYTLATQESKDLIKNKKLDLEKFKTIIHGDLNLSNIFFDYSQDKVYLIDTASMADSLDNEKSPLYDLLELVFRTKILFLEDTQFTPILNESFERFICGYCESFPFTYQRDFKVSILNYVKKLLREGKQRIKDHGYKIDFRSTLTHLDRFILLARLCNLSKEEMVKYLDRDNWTY